MIFEAVNYSYLVQDFAFAAAAGFATGFINQLLCIFVPHRKLTLFFKDIAVGMVFAVALYSYVISFTNYPDIRLWHILGGFGGFLCFSYNFSTFFQKIFVKIFKEVKNNILCLGKKIKATACDMGKKTGKNGEKCPCEEESEHLQRVEVLVYNL